MGAVWWGKCQNSWRTAASPHAGPGHPSATMPQKCDEQAGTMTTFQVRTAVGKVGLSMRAWQIHGPCPRLSSLSAFRPTTQQREGSSGPQHMNPRKCDKRRQNPANIFRIKKDRNIKKRVVVPCGNTGGREFLCDLGGDQPASWKKVWLDHRPPPQAPRWRLRR